MQPLVHAISKQTVRKTKTSPALLTALLFVFVGGFIPQLLGLLSLTASNFVVLFFLLLFTAKSFNSNKILHSTIAFLVVSLYTLIAGLIVGSSITSLIIYFYYLIATYIALKSARIAVDRRYLTQQSVMKYLPLFLCIQIIVCLFQNILSVQISQFSKMPVAPVDVASGTFYLASDASLCFFCLISTIFVFATNQPQKTKYLILCLCIIIVSLTDSKAIQLIFLATSCILAFFDVASKIKSHRKIIATLSPFFLLGIALIAYENFSWVQILVQETLSEAYDKRFASIGASRLAPIGEMLYGENPFFGHGLLAYYNPIDKNWLYNSGSSLFYTIFIDSGLPAIFLFYSFFLYFIHQHEKRILFIALYFLAFFTFSFFNFALTDIGAMFSLGTYLTLQKNYLRSKYA